MVVFLTFSLDISMEIISTYDTDSSGVFIPSEDELSYYAGAVTGHEGHHTSEADDYSV